jgi:hypothetical protein
MGILGLSSRSFGVSSPTTISKAKTSLKLRNRLAWSEIRDEWWVNSELPRAWWRVSFAKEIVATRYLSAIMFGSLFSRRHFQASTAKFQTPMRKAHNKFTPHYPALLQFPALALCNATMEWWAWSSDKRLLEWWLDTGVLRNAPIGIKRQSPTKNVHNTIDQATREQHTFTQHVN